LADASLLGDAGEDRTRSWRFCRPQRSHFATASNWHGRQGSNLQPSGSEPDAPPIVLLPYWSGWLVTIQRPQRPKRGALSTELHPGCTGRTAPGQLLASHPGWLRAKASSALGPSDFGAHGRIRTRIFLPVTFVLIRSQEGYVRVLAGAAGIDPASPG
jgi:hypothetical protein